MASVLKPTDEAAITVHEVSKTFRLPHERTTSIKSAIVGFYKRKKYFEKQYVLQDVSFDIKKGEFFGIVGRNGSGKSTLLKMLAGIYVPSSGSIHINGMLTPFIELGVGFNPELTGRENVFLNGALLGFDRKDMLAMYDDIVEFAELERFMDQRLKNYSSGMQVRLAFSIAIRARSEIMLIDEVLAVGDTAFQQKCFDYFDKLKADKRTIVFVSHDMEAVKKYCDRAVLINKGRMVSVGDPQDIAEEYRALNDSSIDAYTAETNVDEKNELKIALKNEQGKASTRFVYGQKMHVTLQWPSKKIVENAGVAIYTSDGVCVYATNTFTDKSPVSGNKVTYAVQLSVGAGRYRIVAATFLDSREKVVDFVSHGPAFSVDQQKGDDSEGIVRLTHEWK